MNVKRFVARTSRDALSKIRQAFGEDGVVLSTRPCSEGVEVLAMPAASVEALEQLQPREGAPHMPVAAAPARPPLMAPSAPPRPAPATPPVSALAAPGIEVGQDVERLAMSTLSFQDFVRERMLKRRQEALARQAPVAPAAAVSLSSLLRGEAAPDPADTVRVPTVPTAAPAAPAASLLAARPLPEPAAAAPAPSPAQAAGREEQRQMLDELREMRGMIEERFGAMAFMERFQRSPVLARLTQKLLDCGFSPALIRKLVQGAPGNSPDLLDWCAGVLERNLAAGEDVPGIEDQGGVWALIGSTGVGKTTSCAKIAAAFAAKYGAANLGLITLDAYRVGAHEQLRAYGRIIGTAVHTAHDRAALEDLLGLLAGKKMVLIDTAGIAQRDSRTRELLEMVSDARIQRLLVLNSAAQGETIEDVLLSYRAAQCRGVVLSKLDEAVKLGPAVDALIRYRLRVLGIANGQRVPEDWHRMSSHALVQRALRGGGSPAYRLDDEDVSLVFSAPVAPRAATPVEREAGVSRGGLDV